MSSVLDLPLAIAMAMLWTAPDTAGETTGGATRKLMIAAPAAVAATVAAAPKASPLLHNEQRWLEAIKAAGDIGAVETLAHRIFTTSSGRHYVPIAEELAAILALRRNPAVVQAASEAIARTHQQQMSAALGREAAFDDLLLAQAIGPEAARRLIVLHDRDPGANVSAVLPDLAIQLPELAFGPRRARSVADMLAEIRRPFMAALEAKMQTHRPGSASTPPMPAALLSEPGPSRSAWTPVVVRSGAAPPGSRLQ